MSIIYSMLSVVVTLSLSLSEFLMVQHTTMGTDYFLIEEFVIIVKHGLSALF